MQQVYTFIYFSNFQDTFGNYNINSNALHEVGLLIENIQQYHPLLATSNSESPCSVPKVPVRPPLSFSMFKAFSSNFMVFPTSITSHFLDPTIEDSTRKMAEIHSARVLLDILEIGETEQFAKAWYAQGFIVLYSLINRASFSQVETFIEQIKREKDNEKFPCVIVG